MCCEYSWLGLGLGLVVVVVVVVFVFSWWALPRNGDACLSRADTGACLIRARARV